nr:odorant-binding protein 5 [Gregopimpla kuwanae]
MYVSVIFTLCIVALAGAYPAPDVSEDTKTMASQNQACVDQTGITLEQLEKLALNPTPDMPKSAMCYLKCVLEANELEIDNVLQIDAAVPKRPEGISEGDARKVMQECSTLAGNDPCETSYVRYTCIFEKGGRVVWLRAM